VANFARVEADWSEGGHLLKASLSREKEGVSDVHSASPQSLQHILQFLCLHDNMPLGFVPCNLADILGVLFGQYLQMSGPKLYVVGNVSNNVCDRLFTGHRMC
jgi:hypothetical protein